MATNILYCIPNFSLGGGTETRLLAEAQYFSSKNIKLFLLVREGFIDEYYYKNNIFVENNIIPLEVDFGVYGRIKDTIIFVNHMINFIDKYSIKAVIGNYNHTIFSASIACHYTKTRFLAVHHFPRFIHSARKFEDFFFDYFILPKINMNFCASKEILLQKQCYTGNVCLAPNMIDNDVFQIKAESYENRERPYWALISRLDKKKLPGIMAFLSEITKYKNSRIKICGDGESRHFIEEYLRENSMEDRVYVLGQMEQKEVSRVMQNSLGVAGVGRVVLEGILMGKPTCIIGYENKIKGLVKPSNLVRFSESNFTGRGCSPSKYTLGEDLKNITERHLEKLQKYVKDNYTVQKNPKHLIRYFEDDSYYCNEFHYSFYRELCLYSDTISTPIWTSELVKNNIFSRMLLTPRYYSKQIDNSWNYFSG